MTKDHGSKMLGLFKKALQDEEDWLQSTPPEKDREYERAIKSVRQLDEKWIQYLVVRQSLPDKDSPTVVTETEGHHDFVFRAHGNGQNLAAFELKGPIYVDDHKPGDKLSEDIAKDCKKLAKNKKLGKVPKYVVLLPYGDESEVREWLERSREKLPHVGPSGHPPPVRLKLNEIDKRGTRMLITLFEVRPGSG